MGNMGATPSWDDEQIAKFGFWEHMQYTQRRFRNRQMRRELHRELLAKLRNLLAVKQSPEANP
jgi:hypothetical protein